MNPGSYTPSKPTPRSAFFRDLSTTTPLFRRNFPSPSPPPPPPIATLDDRLDFSPSPTPAPPSPFKAQETDPDIGPDQNSGGTHSWWSPGRSQEREDNKAKGSPAVESGALIVLPQAREVARMEVQRSNSGGSWIERGVMDEEQWVTVYGFFPGDTNFVLHEFEKCGIVLKHIPGPRDANWMHILYQSRFDAQKALAKHGSQLNSILIIGVKPVDVHHQQYLKESLESYPDRGFMVPLPSEFALPRKSGPLSLGPSSPSPHHKWNVHSRNIDSSHSKMGAIASPTKSVASKVMDLMFGL